MTILIFAGGDPLPPSIVDDLPTAELVVAADSGYDNAAAIGIQVDVLVGDLDSLVADEIPGHVLVERHPTDKEATDLELAIQLAVRDRPDRIVIVGGSGGLLDHELGVALGLVSRNLDMIDEVDWISARGRAHLVRRRRLIHGDVGTRISLIPLGGDAHGVTSKGLRWNLDGEDLLVGSTRGVSNVMEAPVVDVRLERGALLAVLPAGA